MSRKTLALMLTLLVALGGGVAFAWFSSTGTGTAQASSGTLAAPSITASTPGAGTVALTWSAVTAPAGGAVSYYVTRDGAAAAGDCAPASAPTTATSCTDSSVSAGSHSYAVTAVWRSWTAKSDSSGVTVASGAATRLVLAPATTTPAAGATNNLTITAKDSADNTVASYTGDKSLTFGGAAAAPNGANATVSDKSGIARAFGAATTITFDNGVSTTTAPNNGVLRLFKVETATITVSDGTLSGSRSVTVSPGTASSLSVSGYPSSTVAGVSNTFNVKALDGFGNTATGYSGTVAFSPTNDSQAALPANSTLTSGAGTFNATFKTVAGGTKTLTATDTMNSSITGSQSGITVTPGAVSTIAIVSGSPQSATTSTAFASPLVVSASDSSGNPVPGVSVTFAGPLSGASGTFAASGCTSNSPTSQCVATTASNGQATSSTFTANATAGTYNVSASASGNTVNFSLTNTSSAPVLTTLQMLDANADGKVDQVKATFDKPLAASSATAPWTLTNVPSGGTLASVVTSSNVATLTLTPGSGAADTAVGAFKVALAASATGIRDSAGNQSSFPATAPADLARPVLLQANNGPGLTPNLMQAGDSLALVFSESMAPGTIPSTVTVSEQRSGSGSGTASLTIGGLIDGSPSIDKSYLLANPSTASANSSQTVLSNGDKTITVTLASLSGGAPDVGKNGVTIIPATTLRDLAGNAPATMSRLMSALF